jgi:hypothetical protein
MNDVAICNLALSRMNSRPIQSLGESSVEATQCNAIYAFTRDALLRVHPWNFANRRVTLSLLTDTIVGYDYAYQYPSDCLCARYLVNSASRDELPFEVQSNEALDYRMILTDVEDAELVYTARVINSENFEEGFIETISWKMAADLAIPLRGKIELQKHFYQIYRNALSAAAAVDSNEGKIDPEHSNTFLDARA